MSKGPLAIVVVLCGALPAVVLQRARRRSNLVALGAASALAALVVLPWYLHLAGEVQSLASRLGHEYTGPAWDARPPWYYATHLQWPLPWILWVLCGLVHPLLRGKSRRVLVAWTWFVALFLFFSLAPPKMPRYLLPIVPALALLVAVVFSDDERRARRGERDPAAPWVIVPHWVGLLVFSLLFVSFLAAQDWLVTRGWMDERRYGLLPWPIAALSGLVLVGLAVAGLRWHLRGRVLAAGLLCALWASLATALNWDARSRGADPFDLVEAETQRVLAAVGDGRLCVLDEGTDAALDGAFVFATRRLVPAIGSPVAENGLFVIATAAEGTDTRMAEAGFSPVLDFRDAPHRDRRLWR
jgi:4-amino-4-deoxy-L-arabinose transferase-like glycosyltransferase